MTDRNPNFHMLMRQAVRNCTEEEFLEFRTGDVSGVTVHPRIRRKVKTAVRRMVLHSSKGWQILKCSAAACLVIVTVAFASAMCIQPVRAAFWNAIVTWYEKYVGIAFETEEGVDYPKTIEKRILPESLPDGWTLEVLDESRFSIDCLINGKNDESILYSQSVFNDSETWFDNTDCVISEIPIQDQIEACWIQYADGRNTITWIDQYEFMLVGENVTSEFLIEMAESLY